MPDTTYRLRRMKITRIALVPAGDNPGAHAMLIKSRPSEQSDPLAVIDRMVETIVDRTDLTHSDALVEVAKTKEGKALYAEYMADMAY